MNLLNYLTPENEIAQAIVRILWIVCLFWAYEMIKSWIVLRKCKNKIIRCSDIDGLANDMVQILRLRKGDQEKEKNVGEETESLTLKQAGENVFSSYCSEKSINKEGTVARHLRAIFDAGLQDSRLDVGELIKLTNNELFKTNGLLKSLLASFIVLGLLGTLVGLADSLFGLSPVLGKGLVEKTSTELTSGLHTLFTHLKTAFAPSIWGVSLTVLGVILFSFYLHKGCYPLKNMIERLTLTIWVPKLFLTQSQRYLGTLKLGEEQIQRNLEAINNLIDVQKSINPDVEELSEKLKVSNQTLGLMNDSAREMQNFTDRFVDGVTKISSFQDQLHILYQEMIDESATFQKRVQDSIDKSRKFQDYADNSFKMQNQQLQESYQHLKSYEDAYIEQRKQIDAKLQELLVSAKKAYDNLAERNKEVLDILGKPLTEKLTDIKDELRKDMEDISKRFDAFDVPIQAAAERISTTYENFEKRTQALANELRNEFNTQQENINLGLKEFFKRIENLLSTIQTGFSRQSDGNNQIFQAITERFEKYDTRWQETSRNQADQSEALEKDMSDLADSIRALQGAIGKLEKFYLQRDDSLEKFAALGNLSDQMRQLIHQMREDSQAQEKYCRASFQTLEVIKTLADGIGKITGKEIIINSHLQPRPVERERKPLFDFTHSPIIRLLKRISG